MLIYFYSLNLLRYFTMIAYIFTNLANISNVVIYSYIYF